MVLVYAGPAKAAEFNPTTTQELIDAIDAANENAEADVINLQTDQTYTLTEVSVDDPDLGASGLPAVTSEITINGNGATIERSAADGIPAFRIFSVDGRVPETANLTITDLTVSGGEARLNENVGLSDEGGGILNLGGVLDVQGSNITGNFAEDDGGGISSLRFLESGEVVSRGETTIVDSDISENTAENDGAGINTNNTVTIEGSTISSNVTGDSGGGIDTDNSVSDLTVEESTISDNEATGGDGGGIDIDGTAMIVGSTISDNAAGEAVDDSGSQGGGMWASGLTTVQRSTISGNSSIGPGGGIYSTTEIYEEGGQPPEDERTTIENSTISGNTSSLRGSGVHNNNGYTEINYTTVTNNTSTEETEEAFGVQSFGDDQTGTRLTGTIVVGNTQNGTASDAGNSFDRLRPFESGGGNVIGQTQMEDPEVEGDQDREQDFDQEGDLTGQTVAQAFGTADPTLEDNGGPTQTIALEEGAVAINRIPASTESVPDTDQRGVDRPQGNDSDTGSFEFEAPEITITPETLPDADEGQTYSQQLTASGEGARGPFTFTITEGELPDSLDLSGSGLISGIVEDEPGEYTFTVQAEDSQGFTGEQEYTLTVVFVNDPPSFTLGEDQSVDEDAGPQTVADFATDIDDGDASEEQNVTFTVTNDNTSLFTQGGQPAISPDGTLTYTPAPDANGEATVSVAAKDDGGTANGGDDTSEEQTFTITVGAVNDAPTISGVRDQRIQENTSTGPLRFTVEDPDDPSSDLRVRATSSNTDLVKQSGIEIRGSGENRTVNVTPEQNETGTTRITLTVTDPDGLTSTETFTVTVTQARCTIVGTSGSDVLRGTPGRDVICGLGGDDTLIGGAGDDILRGGPGDDALKGGPGDDVLIGGPGRDALDGGGGNNQLRQ